ncbi:2-isopropylmalate synthase [Methanimicrococcus stummii]|uniref:2-isopropylmalate synthase n=1 Tax=Methanimicrococcus stummii TaxID=3028294 RepID=UPI003B968A39
MILFENLRFLDTTLRDGEQTPGVALSTDDKLKIATALDDLGVHIIEAGSAVTSAGERAAIKAVADLGLNAEICSYCRMRTSDIDLALECDVDSVHLVVPSSNLHIETKLKKDIFDKKDREDVLMMAGEVAEYAKSHGLIVEFSAEDASRADFKFLKDLYASGVSHGADRLCYCDTVGMLTPEKTFNIFSELAFSAGAPVSVHCHNDFGLAVANTVAAFRAGAAEGHLTVNGIGERSGNAALEEVIVQLEHLYGADTGIKTENLYQVSRLVSRLTNIPVAPNKALVGGNSFTHEAGIHVHDLVKNTASYEPIVPDFVGRTRRVVLGKHAGASSIELALTELKLDANSAQKEEIFKRVKEMGDKGLRVTDADLQTIAESVLEIHCEPTVKLKSFSAVSGRPSIPMASVILEVNGKEEVCVDTGDGPVDAAIRAIQRAVASVGDIVLEEYHVDAITGGTDALVEVTVKMSKDGKAITARGARTDIIEASVEAVINGMNRLV